MPDTYLLQEKGARSKIKTRIDLMKKVFHAAIPFRTVLHFTRSGVVLFVTLCPFPCYSMTEYYLLSR